MFELRTQRLGGCARKMKQQVMRKLAPANFREKLGIAPGGRRHFAFGRHCFQSVPDLARTDFAEVQMRRKARCAGDIGPIAFFRIVVECPREKFPQIFHCAGLARLPSSAQPVCPIYFWLELQFIQRK